MERESFVVYKSFVDAIGMLPREQQLECYEALFKYGFEGIEETHEGAVSMFMALVKPQIDKNNQRYENGTRGGRPKGEEKKPNNNQTETKPKPNNNQTETKAEPNVNVNDNVSVNDNDNVSVSVSENDNESVSENVSLSESEADALRERASHELWRSFKVQSAFDRFAKHREQMGRPITDEGLIWDRIFELAGDDEKTAVGIFNQAIENGYYSLAPLKAKPKTGAPRDEIAEAVESLNRERGTA